MRPISERRKNQRGFALLMIFLMAAAIALMLYIQLPRVAFETEREKEQLLIDRGEQYKRAIQLYYTAYQRYPSRMEDLESTNDKRYLRHRYKDPYTGKEEWRLIHINGGVLTDSLVQKPPAPGTGTPGSSSSSSSSQLAGSTSSPAPSPASTVSSTTDPNAPPAVNQAVLQRPSDRTLPTNNTFNQTASNQVANPFPNPVPGQPNAFGQPANYNDPATYPPMSLYPNGYNAPPVNLQGQPGFNQPGFNPGLNQPGQIQQGFNQPGFNQPGLNQPGLNQPGLNQPGINQPGINQPGLNQPGLQGGIQQAGLQQNFPQGVPGQQTPVQQFPGQAPSGGLPGGFVPGVPTPPGLNPNFPNQFPDPNNPGNGQQQPPVQQQVFQPNPNAGLPPQFPGGGQSNNQAINLINNLLTTPRQPPPGIGPSTTTPQTTGVGIAGVASTYTGPAIKSYGDRTEFEEWEFVFQPKTQQSVGTGAQPLGPNGQNPPPGQQNGQGATIGTQPQISPGASNPNTPGLLPRF